MEGTERPARHGRGESGRRLGLLALAASLAGHGAAAAAFALAPRAAGIPERWATQFYLLVAASALLAPLILARRGRPMGAALLAFQAAIFLVAGRGARPAWAVEAALAAALAVEAAGFLPLAAAGACAAGLLAAGLSSLGPAEAWDASFPAAPVADRLCYAFFLAAAALPSLACNALSSRLGRLSGDFERLDRSIAQLADANMSFQSYAAQAGASSADRERKRISRDIHDTAVHSFVNVIMLAEAATDRLGERGGGASQLLAQIIAQCKGAVSETRASLRELRDMEEGAPAGVAAVRHLARVFSEATGVRVTVNCGDASLGMDETMGEAVYRVVQEGLTNAFRHGKATAVDVDLRAGPGGLVLRVRDDGSGASTVEKGIGLQGMEERLRALGGRLEAGSLADGFELRASIPYPGKGD